MAVRREHGEEKEREKKTLFAEWLMACLMFVEQV
jgi:hypothetical protein